MCEPCCIENLVLQCDTACGKLNPSLHDEEKQMAYSTEVETAKAIDLHVMKRDEAMRRIDRAIRDAGPYTFQLRLVHGFHRETYLCNK